MEALEEGELIDLVTIEIGDVAKAVAGLSSDLDGVEEVAKGLQGGSTGRSWRRCP